MSTNSEWSDDNLDHTSSLSAISPSELYEDDSPALTSTDRKAIDSLPPRTALLIVHKGPNMGARFLLDSDRVVAGRHPKCEIFLDDVTVSRRHAAFERDGEGFRVVDQGSLNGTYVQMDRVDSAHLEAGQEVQIGKYRLVYHPFTGAE